MVEESEVVTMESFGRLLSVVEDLVEKVDQLTDTQNELIEKIGDLRADLEYQASGYGVRE
jgi:hypothetical protein